MRKQLAIVAALVALAGCRTQPLSYADVNPPTREADSCSVVDRVAVISFFGWPQYLYARKPALRAKRAFVE